MGETKVKFILRQKSSPGVNLPKETSYMLPKYQNTMMGQAQDRHSYSKREKPEERKRLWVPRKFKT